MVICKINKNIEKNLTNLINFQLLHQIVREKKLFRDKLTKSSNSIEKIDANLYKFFLIVDDLRQF